MFCIKCGQKMIEDSRFCVTCGYDTEMQCSDSPIINASATSEVPTAYPHQADRSSQRKKRLAFILISVVAIIILIFALHGGRENTNDWREYANAELDFFFMYPRNWELVENTQARVLTVAVSPDDGEALFMIIAGGRADPMLLYYSDDEIIDGILNPSLGNILPLFRLRNIAIERDWGEGYESVSIFADVSTRDGAFELDMVTTNEDGRLIIAMSLAMAKHSGTMDLIWDSFDFYY